MRGLVLFFKVHLYSGNHLEINIQVFQVLYLYCIYLIFRFVFFLLTIHNLNAVYILFSFVLMPRRAFPFFFRTMCCRCLHPVDRISPQRVSQGLLYPPRGLIHSALFASPLDGTFRQVFPSHLPFSDAGKPTSLSLLYALLKIFSPITYLQ